MWIYNSSIGTMKIYQNPRTGRFIIQIKDEQYGGYHSAVAAADDVYCHATGCYEWDCLDGSLLDVPTDIYEWERR